jgi:hypothetical protein
MNDELTIDGNTLAEEIGRYLAAVELFRALGCEPRWLPEAVRPGATTVERPSVAIVRRTH